MAMETNRASAQSLSEEEPEPSTTAASHSEQYWYRDTVGAVQGPFSTADLLDWRAHLPMDLIVYSTQPDVSQDAQARNVQELALLLGDGHLLTQWKAALPPHLPPRPAPPAAWYEDFLAMYTAQQSAAQYCSPRTEQPPVQASAKQPRNAQPILQQAAPSSLAANAAVEDDSERDPLSSADPMEFGTVSGSYADAALAGLPADDEAVRLATLARSAGKSLQDLVQFSHQSSVSVTRGKDGFHEYSVSAQHVRGRLNADRAQEASGSAALYGDLGSWIDPNTVETALLKLATRKKQGLAPGELKAIKVRKAELKMKRQRGWLSGN